MKKGPFTRESILEKAYELIEEHGFDNVSYNSLAREVGIKPQSMYRYVVNIDDLKCSIVARYLNELVTDIELEVRNQSGKLALKAVADTLYSYCFKQKNFHQLFYLLNAYKNTDEISEQLKRLRLISNNLIKEFTEDENELIRRQQLFIGFIIGNFEIIVNGIVVLQSKKQKQNFNTTIDQIIGLVTTN